MTKHKEAAVRFLQLVVDGNIDEAYDQYVDMNGKHHNFYFAAGFPALKAAMKENHQQFPHKALHVKHAIEEGDMVAVHSHLILEAGGRGMSVVHLLRFEGDHIVEMWDVGAAIPEDSPNSDGPF